ncbi:hypothetical protein EYF80_009458 [Liparis tanakae]|uniref:Uncharacterized protein n=1 Tax=Liparis tanakae TaxID=230148 RepID=A0A4Z2ISE2_9TELE|nr:hypothetical protein EYF80_009458 [Liparis tanakae]
MKRRAVGEECPTAAWTMVLAQLTRQRRTSQGGNNLGLYSGARHDKPHSQRRPCFCLNFHVENGNTVTPTVVYWIERDSSDPELVRSRFALNLRINLNKERNKRARGLRVDTLTINAPPPNSSPLRKQGSQSANSEGEFRESEDCSLLLFRWLALTPQAPSGTNSRRSFCFCNSEISASSSAFSSSSMSVSFWQEQDERNRDRGTVEQETGESGPEPGPDCLNSQGGLGGDEGRLNHPLQFLTAGDGGDGGHE